MLPRFLSTCGHIILIYLQAFFYCGLLIGWLGLPGEAMSHYLLLLLGAPVMGLYLLYAAVCYLSSQPILPTHKMIKVVLIVSAALVMLASILDPLDVINFVFIASLLLGSTVSWVLHRLMARGQISKGNP